MLAYVGVKLRQHHLGTIAVGLFAALQACSAKAPFNKGKIA